MLDLFVVLILQSLSNLLQLFGEFFLLLLLPFLLLLLLPLLLFLLFLQFCLFLSVFLFLRSVILNNVLEALVQLLLEIGMARVVFGGWGDSFGFAEVGMACHWRYLCSILLDGPKMINFGKLLHLETIFELVWSIEVDCLLGNLGA